MNEKGSERVGIGADAPEAGACCGPSRDSCTGPVTEPSLLSGERGTSGPIGGEGPELHDVAAHARRGLADRVAIPAGTFWMGTDEPGFPGDGEGPRRRVRLDRFWIDRHAVTNLRFHTFVQETGFVTDAERFGWSFVFASFLPPGVPVGPSPAATPWWRKTMGADWRHPFGPGSSLEGRWDHPVVHVSWNDARAFAQWASGALPTEAQWEYAARGGFDGRVFPWGDALEQDGVHRANVWQGVFPTMNSGEDGFVGTAPVDAYEPNGFGLCNVVGNVWEWCFDAFETVHDGRPASNPRIDAPHGTRVMKGGSYLCHDSYCNRYRLAARTHGEVEDGTGHVGFRVAYPATS